MAHTFDRLIINFFMSHNQAFRQILTADSIAVILTGKVNSACRNLAYRMIEATMAELHLMRLSTVSHGEELMPHTDSENWNFALNTTNHVQSLRHIFWIARSIGQHDAVRIELENFLSAGIIRYYCHAAVTLG